MTWSVTTVVLLLLLAIGLIFWMMGGQLASQYQQLAEQLPKSLENLQKQVEDNPWGRRLFRQLPSLEKMTLGRVDPLSRITGAFSGTLGALANVIVVVFIGLYGAFDPDTYVGGLLRLVPPRKRQRATEILRAIADALQGWLIARFFSMAVVGTTTTIGLWLLGVPMALTLGLLAGLFGFIPYVGPILAAVPALLLALATGPQQALYVGLLYLAVQMVETYALTPLVEQEAVKLPPALTIVVMLLFGVLVGGLGVALAAPLTASVNALGDSLAEPVRDTP
jgi:predicted PurR-regulated permease PerM